MKNPLRKRLPRELKQDAGKYTALFLFLTVLIGFVSGFLVADGSMKTAYDNSFTDYRIEDGHFTLLDEAEDSLFPKLEQLDLSVYDMCYKDKKISSDHTLRIYPNRTEINLVCILEGCLPERSDEIAIDRLYAENNGIALGDTLTADGTVFTVCGLAALSDYSALFQNNTDMMFDANRFCVSVVTRDVFDDLSDSGIHYCYAWRNDRRDLSEEQKREQADEILDLLVESAIPTDFVPQESNQAIVFTGEDMGSDKAMIIWLLYIILVVLAFSFSVTTRSTIEQEASAIGTLRASGYTRGELLRHYLTLPMLVTLCAALTGNILGYTAMKQIVVGLYYHSYSLQTYVTIWSAEAFVLTTLIPCLIILAVNLLVLTRMLSLPPIQFLRHELRNKKKKYVLPLPNFRFLTRFRLRIILQNLSAYLIMAVGILLASLLLMFGMIMRPLLDHFKQDVIQSQFAAYQYILKGTEISEEDQYSVSAMLSPFLDVFRDDAELLGFDNVAYFLGFDVETKSKQAEKYSVCSLQDQSGEEITVYGIQPDSRYLTDLVLPEDSDEVIVSDGYLEKYHLQVGDTVTFEEKYEDDTYQFRIAGTYPYAAALSVFLSQDAYHETFHYTDDSFSGYFSNEKLTDLDEEAISAVITQNDLTVLADQLDDSMGAMMPMFGGVAMLLYMLVLYLLTKMMVEKNAQSISMIKILGYEDREISKLYSTATAFVVGASLLISLPVCTLAMRGIYAVMMQEINGWLTFYLAPWIYSAMLVCGAVCYAAVHWTQMRKIRSIPLAQALKRIE